MPRNSPGSTANEMSRFANVPLLYLLLRFKTSTAGLSNFYPPYLYFIDGHLAFR